MLHLLIGGYLGIAVWRRRRRDIFSGITVFPTCPAADPIYMGGQRVTSVGAFYYFVTQYIFLGYENPRPAVDLSAFKEPEIESS